VLYAFNQFIDTLTPEFFSPQSHLQKIKKDKGLQRLEALFEGLLSEA
jgi:hypothetical protein